jgi:predicted  nucleic acid-binding Zn-ribbon protein
METITRYPSHIARPFTAFTQADDESAMHKSLLDMGESFLTYLVGIMFGEYKRSGEISDRLESEFYKYSSRKPSFGVFLSFMRLLSKEMNETILSDKFDKGKKYGSVSDFIFHFNMLKTVIDEGLDSGFSERAESLMKGRTAGQKGLMDFFDTFIMIRNIYAHPDEKAGPKDNKRKWPLGDDYYAFINPLMHAALSELVDDFEILQSYKPILAKLLDDKNKKGTFLVELGAKDSELKLELSTDDLRFMNTDLRYLLDPEDKLFVKLYYHAIPQLNPKVAKKIIDREKAKAMEPHMLEMIHAKLIDDGKIDDMEYLILRDTAKTSAISDEKLFQLIEKVRNKLGIKDSVGTPDNLGDIFIEAKDPESKPKFNPWWLHYLSMVGKVDPKVIKKEKDQEKKLEGAINKLKTKKKSLPVMKRLANAKKNLKDKKAQKSKQIKSINERIAAKREMRKKASKPEQKRNLLADIDELKTKSDEKREFFDAQIYEMISRIGEIEQEREERSGAIDEKITDLTDERNEYSRSTQWGMHKNLWKEINQYVDHLLNENLNSDIIMTNKIDEDIIETGWANSPNRFQIGNLSYYYWAKIHPVEAPLGIAFPIGYCIGNFKWFPNNIDNSIEDDARKKCSVIWPTIDVDTANKIDIDGSINAKRVELQRGLFTNYREELLKLGANVKCSPNKYYGLKFNKTLDGVDESYLMPLKKYIELEDEYEVINIYSRIWPVDKFYNDGNLNLDTLAKYERETVTILQLFSNVVVQLNDYALEIGINQETIAERFDQFNRMKEILFLEFEKKYPEGTLFRPTKDEVTLWREFAKRELGLSDYLYDMIHSKFRFSSGYRAKEYLQSQRDKSQPDSKEYAEWNNKLKELN